MSLFNHFMQTVRSFYHGWMMPALLCMMYFVSAASGQTIIFKENFESGQGNWSADNGVWEIGKPKVGPDSAHLSQNCAGTILSGNYPPNANTRLISPAITLPPASGGETIRLYFWQWFAIDEESSLGPDEGRIQISVNNGAWQPQSGLAGPYSGFGVAWTQAYVDLTPYAGSNIRLAFYFTSTSRDQAAGWYVDDIVIQKKTNRFNLTDSPESFESGIGDWHADNGVWEVGKLPTGSGNAYQGQNCAVTFLNGNYPSRANTRLISPEFDLSNLTPNTPEKMHLHFWHWFVTNEEISSGVDQGRVQLSVNNGPWEDVTESFSGESPVWTHVCADISKFAGMKIRLAFYFTSTSRDEARGWYIDNISIHTIPNLFNITNNPEAFESGIGEWWVDNGVWEVGHPTVGPMNGYNSPNCAGTILGNNYPNLANTRLISPEFKLGIDAAGKTPALFFRHWFRMNETSSLGPDRGYVQISVKRGPWKNIAGPYSGISEVWTQAFVGNLSAYTDSTVRIAFFFNSSSRDVDVGWYIDDVKIDGIVSVRERLQENDIIESFTLQQNYPNPFNPSTTILYDLPRAGQVEVEIFTLLGERIRTLVKERQAAGQHRLQWDGRDEKGAPMPSGVYLYRLRAGEFVQTRKMILAQ